MAIVPSPNTGNYHDYLDPVTAISTNDVWAVGSSSVDVNDFERRTLILHWDGAQWTRVSSPNPVSSVNELYGVSARAANDVWAVGNYLTGSRT